MLDFTLKNTTQKIGGLNMALYPGTYEGNVSQASLYVSEAAFSFLEEIIRKNSVGYARSYSHWGITKISRIEWNAILRDWENLKSNIAKAKTIEDLVPYCNLSEEIRIQFSKAFDINKANFLKMIDQLVIWIRTELVTHDQISILGI